MSIKAGSQILASDFTGMIWPSIARAVPDQWLLCDGSAISRSTYAALFAILCPSATITMTIATPGVITWTGHLLVNGDVVVFTTTGALPTGLTAGVSYYVVSAATNTFQVSATKGGSSIATSGSQSGVHTARCVTFGKGDNSTTFNLPDLRGRAIIGTGSGVKTIILPGVAISGNAITINASSDFQQGMAVLYTGSSITGLTTATTYYVIAVTSTTIKLASSQANANAATAMSISGTPTTDTLAYTLSTRNIGDTGGEETHGLATTELASHTHSLSATVNVAGGGANQSIPSTSTSAQQVSVQATGGNAQHNIMGPFAALNYFIHI